jgi:hypothetical protein
MAELARHAETKQFWARLEENWRLLSQSHQHIERVDAFLGKPSD